jgi:hypothetical protein
MEISATTFFRSMFPDHQSRFISSEAIKYSLEILAGISLFKNIV